MTEEINVGDWISYSVSGLPGRGKVVDLDSETYTAQPDRLSGGQLTAVGKDGVKKIAPPEEEE